MPIRRWPLLDLALALLIPIPVGDGLAPLYRGEDSRNRRTGGAGRGLTTARQIPLAHGGDLAASNATDGGAIFAGSPAQAIPEPARPATVAIPPEIERRDTDSR